MLMSRVACLLTLALIAVQSAGAQTVSGSVVDESTGRPIAGATVRLLTLAGQESGSTTTNRSGSWIIEPSSAGRQYRVRVERLGYATIETAPFLVGSTPITMNLATRAQVVVLEGVTAQEMAYVGLLNRMSTRKSARTLLPDEVARRMDRAERWGTGRLVNGLIGTLGVEGGQDWPTFYNVPLMNWQVASRGLSFGRGDFRSPWEMARMEDRRKCDAIIAVDGVPHFKETPNQTLTDLVPLYAIRAVEIYPDPNFLPLELRIEEKRSRLDPELDCGVVVIWTADALGLP